MKLVNPKLKNLMLTTERKSYSIMAITAVLVGLFIFFSIRPTFVKIAQIRREITDNEEFLREANAKLNTLTGLIEDSRQVKSEIEFMDKVFTETDKDGFLVANFDSIATQSGVILDSVEFVDEETLTGQETETLPESTKKRVIRLSISGDNNTIKSFVDYLEGFPLILDIKSVSYSQRDENQAEDNAEYLAYPLVASVEANYYYWYVEELIEPETVEPTEEIPVEEVEVEGVE